MDRPTILANWRRAFKSYGPYDTENRILWLNEVRALSPDREADPELWEVMEEMVEEVEECLNNFKLYAEREDPLAYFRPSWEQAQIINAWSPEFEPEVAPKGYRSVASFCANRIGKTASCVIDTLLWLIPNNPNWEMFEWHDDFLGRGKYRIFPRPDWERWKRKGKMSYSWEDAPPKGKCDIWHGVGRDEDWTAKVYLEYRKWMSVRDIGIREDGGQAIYKKEKRLDTAYGHSIIGMSINAEVEAWAGKACWRLNIDEGITRDIMSEGLVRIMDGGYLHWAYTPAAAANIGEKSRVAWEHFKKPDKFPLVGQTKFFTTFKLKDAPDWIVPPGKKEDDLRRFYAMGAEGRVRAEGGFQMSVPVVFSNFDRERSVLPLGTLELIEFLKEKDGIQTLYMLRGFDEGMANPSACVWVVITKNNEYVCVQSWEEAGLSVGQRCEKIIDLSRNDRTTIKWDEDESRRRYKENQKGWRIRRTFADSKMFKRNQENVQDDWTDTYRKMGLNMEKASNIGTAERYDTLNEMFRPDPTRKHILSGHPKLGHLIPRDGMGCRMYISFECPHLINRLEELLWTQLSTGPNKGQFTEKPEDKDDHQIDGLAYVCASKLRWMDVTKFEHPQEQGVYAGNSITGY